MRKPLFYAMQPLYGAERRARFARRRAWLLRMLAACAIMLFLLYGVPLVCSWFARAWLGRYFASLFERDVAIGRVWLNPWQGRLEIHDIRVPGVQGSGSGNLLVVGRAHAQLSSRALLDHRLHVQFAEIEDASINLHCLDHHGVQAGRFSFFGRPSSTARQTSGMTNADSLPAGRPRTAWSMQIDALSITNSSVFWQDSRSGAILREAAWRRLNGAITNISYMASSFCAKKTWAGAWIEGEWAQGTNQAAAFSLLGSCAPVIGGMPEASFSVELSDLMPSLTLRHFWPSAAQAFGSSRHDVSLAGGVCGRNVDFSFEMRDLAGVPLSRLEHGFYDWQYGCGGFDGLLFLYPDGSLARPVCAVSSGSFDYLKKGASTSVRVALEKPLLTWPGRACKESHQDAAAPPQQLDSRVSSQIGGGLVLEDISVSGGDVAYAGRDASGAWQIAACGRSLSLNGSNIWLRGGTVPENEQGALQLSGFCGFNNDTPAEIKVFFAARPGASPWLPELSATGSVSGLALSGALTARQQELLARFVAEPLNMNFTAALGASRSDCSLTVSDADSNEALRLEGLRYDWEAGEMRLKMLGLCQPRGFGSGFMLALRNARVKANPDFLATRRLAVSNGVLSGLEFVLARNASGALNLDDLLMQTNRVSSVHGAEAMCEPLTPGSLCWEFTAKKLFLTNAFLLYKGYSDSDAATRKLAACWGEANDFEYSVQNMDLSWLIGSFALGGAWRQGGHDNDALFNGSLDLLWARPAMPEARLSCGFTNLIVASFGQAQPAWCRAFLGDAVLSGHLDITTDQHSATASGRVVDAASSMEAGLGSLAWEHASNEWLLKDVVVSQPELFGPEKLFAAGLVRLRAATGWVPGRPFVVHDFAAADVFANLACDPSGRWIWSFFEKNSALPPCFSARPTASANDGGSSGLLIEKASLERLRVGYLEQCRNKPHIASNMEIDHCELANLVFGKASQERAGHGSFTLSARLHQAERPPALLIVDGRQESPPDASREWYMTLGITDWEPLDFFTPADRTAWERDIGPLDLVATIGFSDGLLDGSFETRLSNGFVLAKCDAADWQPGSGEFSLRGLRVESPKAFRLSPLLDAPEIRVSLGFATPSNPCVRIEKALVSSPSIRLERNRSGARNTDYLKALFQGLPSSSKASENEMPGTDAAAPVFVEQARIEGMNLCYSDPLAGRHGLELQLTGIHAEAMQLPLRPCMDFTEKHEGRVVVSAILEQKDLPPGFFQMTVQGEFFPDGEHETRVEAALDGLSPALLQGLSPGGLHGAPLSALINATIDRRAIRAGGILETFDGDVVLSAGGVDYCRESGDLSLDDIFVSQLPGFGNGPLLLIPSAQICFAKPVSEGGSLLLEQFDIESPGFFPVRNRDGELNVSALIGAFKRPSQADVTFSCSTGESFGMKLNHLNINNAFGIYADFSAHEPSPVMIKMDNMKILGKNIRWGGEQEEDAPPGELGFVARLLQPPCQNGYFGGLARFDSLGPGTPVLKASFRAAGLEFATLAGWLPPSTPKLLGADAADVAADIEMAPKKLHCDLQVLTSAGNRFSLSLRGTPSEPQVTTGSVLYGILTRASGGLGVFARHTLGAGAEVVQSVAQAAYGLAQGAWRVVSSVSSGLFTTLRGVATADVDDMTDGLAKTTIGAFDATTESFMQVGVNVMDAADRATSQGSRAANEWRSRNFERWLEAWKSVQADIPPAEGQLGGKSGEPAPKAP